MSLPSRPDLTRLKRLARELQRSAASGDVDALARLRACFPDAGTDGVKLSQAQLVIAREHGSLSWPALAARVEKRATKQKAAEARAQMRKADAETLAARWFSLAESGDFDGLVAALAVGKRRMHAARALMQRDHTAYDAFLEHVIHGTSHTNPRIRFECTHALDTFGDARCREPLIRLMDDPVPRVRWIAMHALTCHACNDASCTDDATVHARIACSALTDASIQVRRHATAALGMIGTPAAATTLQTIIANESDPALLRTARWALSRSRANESEPADK